MDNETMNIAKALLFLRYGATSEAGYFDSEMSYPSWNSISHHVGNENVDPIGIELSSNYEDHSIDHNSSHEIAPLSPKDSSESTMNLDSSSDASPPTIYAKTRPVSRSNVSRAPRNTLKGKSTTFRKRRGNLPKHCVMKMLAWLELNRYNAYPSEMTKQEMAADMGITVKQVSNWFINARRRRLDMILAGEGKCASDFRITRKKKGSTTNHRTRKTSTKVKLSYQAEDDDLYTVTPRPPQTPPTPCCSTSPSIYESSTDESIFEFRPITPTPRERTLDFASL